MLNSWRTKLLAASAVVLALTGCNAVFGISKGELEEPSADGGAGSGGTAGTSGGAGASGASGHAGTSSGGSAGTGGSGGQGGTVDDAVTITIHPDNEEFSFKIMNSDGERSVKARLSYSFEIDKYEVTNRRYRLWRDASPSFKKPAHGQDLGGMGMKWDSAWDELANVADNGCEGPSAYNPDHPVTDSQILTGDEYYPIVCMNWYAALALCAFEGKRLPTETEWMYVATSHGTRDPFPFDGTDIDCSKAIFDSGELAYCGFPKRVGSAPAGASLDGVMDLAGSVFEWVWDQEGDYPTDATTVDYPGPMPSDGTRRRLRKGGAFISKPGEGQLETPEREPFPPIEHYNDAGFRCARTVP